MNQGIRYYLVVLISCFAFAFAGVSVAKEKTLTFVTEAWEGATNADGTGAYWDLIRLVFEPEGYKVVTKTMPYARAQNQVKIKHADGLVGAYPDEIPAIYPKTHIDNDVVAALFLKGTINPWKTGSVAAKESNLAGKKVVWIRGYGYDQYLKVKMKFKEINGTKNALRLIDKKRTDVYLDSEVTIEDFFAGDGNKEGQFNKSNYEIHRVLNIPLYIAFAETDKGRELAKLFDERMKGLIGSGKIKAIYQKYDYEYPF